MRAALRLRTVIPAFNIPYLPMMAPVVQALTETDCLGFIAVARLEWEKFEAGSPAAIADEYRRVKMGECTRLHLDHVPVLDEDDEWVDYEAIISDALALGFDSVMVDGSRLPFAENVEATRRVVALAQAAGVPVEAELGAVLGHEAGPLPPYEELFASGRGFTAPEEARDFVDQTGVDWLSVAIGNVHGAISAARKDDEKIAARLNVPHLDTIRAAVDAPLVLHGGSGIPQDYVREAVLHGIAKVNVGTAIRQPYEQALPRSVEAAREAVYTRTLEVVRDELGVAGTATLLRGGSSTAA
ncbi:MAG: class II fructose-bisphosphate aldolase [Lentisphaerae bacterium]|nr:class II fructose-bisphosphate aldolase [Lentisphaerota bacterium]MBT5610051.1 class II fructose-bisphosphate aldolase [Lentisphaerota bacterium]MBT7055549.1 class II fructose-bisphosphate aldolase [Lentisphaerota bacterium]MBT7841496.1 class II fructose-bisphosphate aldolase [Lentisphaerota bacterium]